MTVTLTDDEIRVLLSALAACTVGVLQPDAAATVRLVQSLAKKLRPKNAPAKKKGK